MRHAEAFDQAWPDLSRRLSTSLGARSIPPALSDDIIQETGLRLFRIWDRVDPDRSIYGLTLTIANQVLWGQARERSRYELVDEVPDRAGPSDTERETLARLELSRVRRAMTRLSPSYRGVLLAEIDGSLALARGDGALKVMRLRARRRLGALLEQGYGIVVGSGLQNWVARWQNIRRSFSLQIDMVAPAMVVAIAAVLTTSVPGTGPEFTTAGADPRIVLNGNDGTAGLLALDLLDERPFALRPTLPLPQGSDELKRSGKKLARPATETDVIVDAGPVYVAEKYPTNEKGEPVEKIVKPATCGLDLEVAGDCEDRR